MSDFPASARVVIIGGGAVGASALYHLCKAGWTDCVLLEKNELTAGSTWHAAGNVPTFSSSWSIMNMQRYSAQLYRGLGEAVDYPMNYHVTGSVRLGHTKERLQEFQRVVGMGRYQGMDLKILTPNEIKSVYPFLETHDLSGALHDPYDGDIDPAQLTQALAKGARALGARGPRRVRGDQRRRRSQQRDPALPGVVCGVGRPADRLAAERLAGAGAAGALADRAERRQVGHDFAQRGSARAQDHFVAAAQDFHRFLVESKCLGQAHRLAIA